MKVVNLTGFTVVGSDKFPWVLGFCGYDKAWLVVEVRTTFW